jgi:hypothetical protein
LPLELPVAHRIHHAPPVELVPALAQSKHRRVVQIEAHPAGGRVEHQALYQRTVRP